MKQNQCLELMEFKNHLEFEEKSKLTIEKYQRDVNKFLVYLNQREITKELTIEYKKHLQNDGYAVRSINSMLTSMNRFLEFIQKDECKVKILRVQKQVYCSEDKEMTKNEYLKLLNASDSWLHYVIETICSTGIRISELKSFTVENVMEGEVLIECKGKIRRILIPSKLRKHLLKYAKQRDIKSGMIFVTKHGKALDRSYIWAKMKKLCQKAKINAAKVFPHNLRKVFARTFYEFDKDISKLADILGHSSIDTTRIYIMTSGSEHRRRIEKMGLVI